MIKLFFSEDIKNELSNYKNTDELLPFLGDNMCEYDYLSQAQYLEAKTLLPGYLLSSQGDRMAMANSIEGRFPFLDHKVMEFCFKLPPNIRMRALTEKYILKESMSNLLPAAIIKRTKQPYMAPDSKSFFASGIEDYVEEMFSDNSIRKAGIFDANKTKRLFEKCRKGLAIGFKDNMAFVGILSTQLLYNLFVEKFQSRTSNERYSESRN